MSATKINGGTQIQAGTITNNEVSASAAIATSKLADSANFILRTGATAFTADQSMGSHKLTNVTDPASAQDAATKNYVDQLVNGLDWKNSVRAATTAAGTLASSFANGSVIDGVTLATGDRILIKNQSTGSENGLYTVNVSGSPTRTTDADASAEVTANLAVFVSEGTTNADTQWSLSTNDPITVGSTSLTFTQIGGSTTYTGSNGINVAGTVISPTYGSSANTICQGNDSRLSDSRTPTGSAGGDLAGTYPNPTVAQSSTAFALTGTISPSQITADQNNYNPASLSTATVLRLNSDALRHITGLSGGATGRIIVIHNVGSNAIVLDDESGSSTAGNRFSLPGSGINIQLDSDDCATLMYDNTATRWRVIGVSPLPFGTAANTVCQGNDSRLSTPVVRETPSGTINGSNVTFTLAFTPISGTEHLYLNGILQDSGAGNDYTISGATITMLSAPLSGDKLRASYLK